MVDIKARKVIAVALRRLADGIITNEQYELESMISSEDRIIKVLRTMGWCLYSDLRGEYRLSGKDRLDSDSKKAVARCVLFLQTKLDYEWPVHPKETFLVI